MKNRVCTLEVPIGTHMPERVCRFNTEQPSAMPIEEVLRTQSVQQVTTR